MTAAHAYEYEVPPRAGVPADAIEAAAGGEVVYLVRRGERLAAVVPPEAALHVLEEAARAAEAAEENTAEMCRRLWASVADADDAVREATRRAIDEAMEAAEEAADLAAARASLADPAPSIPAGQVWAELGLDDAR